MEKQKVLGKESSPKESVFITFTDLYEMKQEGLEELLRSDKEVFILSKKIPPIKLTMAKLS